MFKKISTVLLTGLLIITFTAQANEKTAELESRPQAKPIVHMDTNVGSIYIELNPDKAPVSVKNFLTYVSEGFYKNTMFHRIIGNFMIQGGGFDLKYHKKEVHDPIKIESDNGLKNERGTIAMARTNVPDSATSQFFINVVDNDMLDFTKPTTRGYGYAVFGQVLEGMDTVDKIKETKTRRFSTFRNAPEKDIFINAVTVLEDDALKAFKTKLKKTN